MIPMAETANQSAATPADRDLFRVLWQAPAGGTPVSAVRVEYGRHFRRLPHEEDTIEDAWSAAIASNPRIFDKSKFRLASIVPGGAGVDVTIRLGLTGYKEYMGTNRLPHKPRNKLAMDGERVHNDANTHLSNALGCETVLITSDGQLVLLRRSSKVATHGGQFNGPSGHPEPSNAAIVDDEPLASTTDTEAVAQRAAVELFASVVQEAYEETNVPLAALSEPRLIGCMAANDEHGCIGKPDLLFLTRTRLTAAEVRTQYEQGAEEGWESDRLAFFPQDLDIGPDVHLTPVTLCALAELPRHLHGHLADASDAQLRQKLEAALTRLA